jgi:hypothetical protein
VNPIDIASGLLVGLLALWLLGGLAARVGGLLLILAGAANLALGPLPEAVLLIGAGAVLWLVGHWHYALRHDAYKSPLASRVFGRWAPRPLDPTRSRAEVVVADRRGSDSTGEGSGPERGEATGDVLCELPRRKQAKVGPAQGTALLYVPVGPDPLTLPIPRGAAIVGRPEPPCEGFLTVYFVDAVEPLAGLLTLADRALCAAGRMLRKAAQGRLALPRDALLLVGTIDGNEGRITLTGPQSERAVADWLGVVRLDRAELNGTGRLPSGREVTRIETNAPAQLDPESFGVLLRRAGITSGGGEWVSAGGRRTADASEALVWALEEIAREGLT